MAVLMHMDTLDLSNKVYQGREQGQHVYKHAGGKGPRIEEEKSFRLASRAGRPQALSYSATSIPGTDLTHSCNLWFKYYLS